MLKRLRLAKGDILVVAPSADITSVLRAASRLAKVRPELRGMPVIRAWPDEVGTAKP